MVRTKKWIWENYRIKSSISKIRFLYMNSDMAGKEMKATFMKTSTYDMDEDNPFMIALKNKNQWIMLDKRFIHWKLKNIDARN